MATQAKAQTSAHSSESTAGDLAGNIIGGAAVFIGVVGLALLIFFGM
ncbi:hypothetical protein JOF48_000954 [Arthrobacter stackebrandtii]|uniref:Uncharacterized protein n=1 Tax=Arthrobacter stackebrandtii TaxID=272161 RepID=A0ABS4YU75_9MICC|nr:hypothetical protein [Arthrobacter stackebrandtii]MBP2412155.1 hypothetical protein [Arthrobacter stackebrandtii]